MANKIKVIFWFMLVGGINQGFSQIQVNTHLIDLDSNIVIEEHKLDLPSGTTSLNFSDVFDVDGMPMLFAYLYPQKTLYIYDLTNDSLVGDISSHNLGINKIEYYGSDSIMLYGYPLFSFNNDSIIRCVNIKGNIKHIYPLFHPNVVSSKNPQEGLLDDKNEIYPNPQFIHDNKIFMTFNFPYYGLKGYSKKYPIIGYYDLAKDTLVTIDNIWYPNLKEGIYYKSRFYKPNIALKENGNILISFSYTPVFYEWNFKTNKLSTHFVASKFVSSIPYSSTLFNNENDYNDFSNNEGTIYDVNTLKIKTGQSPHESIFSRSFLLPSLTIKGRKVINVFYDENYRYCGESMGFIPKKTYKDNYVSSYMSKGKIVVRFFKPIFKPYNEIELMAKLDSVKKNDIENVKSKNKELCSIAGKDQRMFSYQKNDIIGYLQKTQQIMDTSFSVVILNKGGCGACNEYVLQFLEYNKMVLFNLPTKPFYLLYVNENGIIEDAETYLDGYRLYEKNHVKMDVSQLYKSFHPSPVMNPRLVLVSNKQVIHDNVYFPNEVETLVDDLLKYYGLSEE
jgi:hypothetical protein